MSTLRLMTDGSCYTCAEGSLYRVRNLDNIPMLASGIVIVDVSDFFSPPVCWIKMSTWLYPPFGSLHDILCLSNYMAFTLASPLLLVKSSCLFFNTAIFLHVLMFFVARNCPLMLLFLFAFHVCFCGCTSDINRI